MPFSSLFAAFAKKKAKEAPEKFNSVQFFADIAKSLITGGALTFLEKQFSQERDVSRAQILARLIKIEKVLERQHSVFQTLAPALFFTPVAYLIWSEMCQKIAYIRLGVPLFVLNDGPLVSASAWQLTFIAVLVYLSVWIIHDLLYCHLPQWGQKTAIVLELALALVIICLPISLQTIDAPASTSPYVTTHFVAYPKTDTDKFEYTEVHREDKTRVFLYCQKPTLFSDHCQESLEQLKKVK